MRFFVAMMIALTLILSGCGSVEEVIDTGKDILKNFTSGDVDEVTEEAVVQ